MRLPSQIWEMVYNLLDKAVEEDTAKSWGMKALAFLVHQFVVRLPITFLKYEQGDVLLCEW